VTICNAKGQCCLARAEEIYYGTMYFHDRRRHGGDKSGWVFPARPDDRSTVPHAFFIECPFCGGCLPTMELAISGWIREHRYATRIPEWIRKPRWQADGEGDE
jgi:hypothetical protein